MLATGGSRMVNGWDSVAEQAETRSVIVSVYVPAAFTTMLCDVAPVLQ